jgi:tRNA pseudouridine32 synthase/23S rRNA pseudouridine746 synthase
MFNLVFQNEWFVVVCKDANVSVHRDEEETGLVTEIEKQLHISKLYLVHRLDKMTSGLLILAKTPSVAAQFSDLFASRQIGKFYLALSDKKPKKKQGLVSGQMERSRRSSWKLTTSQLNPAQTQFISASVGEGMRLFLCKPHTGKTHQIRVALKSLGAPIIGDPIYHPSSQADRGYLHAYSLFFELQGQTYSFVSNPVLMRNGGELWALPSIKAQIALWSEPTQLKWPVIRGKKA